MTLNRKKIELKNLKLMTVVNKTMVRLIVLLISFIVIPICTYCQRNADLYKRLFDKLEDHAIIYKTYKSDNMPILLGNTELGGLADPLGRGMYQTWVSDLWTTPIKREAVEGFMLQAPEFINRTPQFYEQKLSLTNGQLTTQVDYGNNKKYESALFFSMDDKHKMVYKIKNTGKHDQYWIMSIPYEGYEIDYSDSAIIKGYHRDERFTFHAWSLQVNDLVYRRQLFGKSSGKYSFILKAEQEAEFIFSVYTHWDGVNYERRCFTKSNLTYDQLLADNNNAWYNNWKNTGIVFLPEEKHSEIFYRSIFWLYSTCGEGRFLQAEAHFSQLTPSLAAAYGYYSDKVNLHNDIWDMHPFTYGAPGWATYSFTMLGNQQKAKNMLDNFYKPELLKRNVTEMFPIGKHKVYDFGKYIGEYQYLNKVNPDALCFGHELTFEGENYIPTMEHRYDWQVHINAFATGNFYRYTDYFNDSIFFAEKTYPVMQGVAEFWSELLNYDKEKDAYVLPVVLSLAEDMYVQNPIDAVLAAKWNLLMASRVAIKHGMDLELSKKWKYIADKIFIPQNKNYYLEYENDDFTREGGGYQGIRGFSYFAFPTAELISYLDKEKADKTMEEVWVRNKRGKGLVAFTISWYALAAAYLGNAELAYDQLTYSNTQLDPSGTAMMEVDGMRAYYLDNYAAYVSTVISMILQSYDNNIKPFAAIPEKWKDVEFYDLPASKGIRVSGKMENGEILWVKYFKDGKEMLKKEIDQIMGLNNENK